MNAVTQIARDIAPALWIAMVLAVACFGWDLICRVLDRPITWLEAAAERRRLFREIDADLADLLDREATP